MLNYLKNDDKKVEYIELIYDLVFVYLIGRNNSLIDHTVNGFIDPALFLTYTICTLITIQLWYITTLFINRYGSNDFSEYVGLFINMFLLYYMADGTSIYWQDSFYKYNIAWMLILLNTVIQYMLKYRSACEVAPWEEVNVKASIRMLVIMIIVIAAGVVLYDPLGGIPLTPAAMVLGFILSIAWRSKFDLVAVDFNHLTERVMLYIVFTFGEMIISISAYFNGPVTPVSFYFSVCAFLIVVGLFMSYGFLYDKLLDREMAVSGNSYLIRHIFIIFALSSLTKALEFMTEEAIALIPKTIYLIASFLIYYVFMLLLVPYTKGYTGKVTCFKGFLPVLICSLVLIAVFYRHPAISIGVSVALTFAIWHLEYRYYLRCLAL